MSSSAGHLRVIKPGMLTTVQDLGRWGYQTYGVPVAGAMDAYSHRLANALVGNSASAATLEVTLLGPELAFERDCAFAVTGARFELWVDDDAVAMDTVCRAPAGARLRFGRRSAGARAYLAITGGIEVPRVFGSRATHLISRMGGVEGRALAVGDLLPVGDQGALPAGMRSASGWPLPLQGGRVRIMLGPHVVNFALTAVDILCRNRYAITPQSNRMGYRLHGPPLPLAGAGDIISDAVPIGSIQVPASGLPILLMADRGTTGGYPKIATVITADLPTVGQLAPGDWLEFTVCDRSEALEALGSQEAALSAV